MFKRFPSIVVIASLILVTAGLTLELGHAQTAEQWTRAVPISGALSGSWYPSIAVDNEGAVHAVWGATQSDETLYYSKYDGLAWSRPIDILLGGPQSVLQIDGRDVLHLMYQNGATLVTTDASVADAGSSLGWNTALKLNRTKAGYMGSMIADEQGILHAVWIEAQDACEKCLETVYGQSSDGGRTWSLYSVLSDTSVLQRKAQLIRSAAGTLYAMWEVGQTATAAEGIAISISTDDGNSWSHEPLVLQDEKEAIRQPLLALDAKDNLVLVYNLGVKDETFYQTSEDQGTTWSERKPIPGLFATKTATGNDYFVAAPDSNRILHFLMVGRTAKDQDLSALYHLTWDGSTWTAPATVYAGTEFIELPALSIANGNRLHGLFSIRDRYRISGAPDSSYQVLYTSLLTDAPAATRVPLATVTPVPTATPTEVPLGTPTRRPSATPNLDPSTLPADDTETAANAQLPIIFGVLSVVGVLLLVTAVNLLLRRRR